ncbi:MAG: hypothetical protein NT133_06040 [Alphaproteobacteria bacterium]|nr:hypothetical protein [Alphaproteobacteria bacterium]
MTAILRLRVDGALQDPARVAGDAHWFDLARPAREIRLVSASARPLDLGLGKDRRRLGVQVLAIRFEHATGHAELPLTDPAFVDGFHKLQEDRYRFTDGDALLPAALLPVWEGPATLCIRALAWRGTRQAVPTDPNRQLLDRFESLGADCEFAFVQRHVSGATHIGLLTWARIASDRLPAALDAGFAGTGDAAQSRLIWTGDEYFLETAWLRTHTSVFTQTDAVGEQDILERGCARLRLLRRKLLADLAVAERVFVHTAPHAALPPCRMHDILAALRRHGPARLLCVTDGAAQPTPQPLADGLHHARLPRFAGADGPYDDWLTLCQEARRIDDA